MNEFELDALNKEASLDDSVMNRDRVLVKHKVGSVGHDVGSLWCLIDRVERLMLNRRQSSM